MLTYPTIILVCVFASLTVSRAICSVVWSKFWREFKRSETHTFLSDERRLKINSQNYVQIFYKSSEVNVINIFLSIVAMLKYSAVIGLKDGRDRIANQSPLFHHSVACIQLLTSFITNF